jgi:hypothetical protein
MKINGVSLTPAASPTPSPFHRLPSGPARSASTSAIRIRLTWPKCRVRSTGSSHRPTAARARAPASRRGRPASRSADHAAATRAAMLATARPSRHPSRLNRLGAANASAANGG